MMPTVLEGPFFLPNNLSSLCCFQAGSWDGLNIDFETSSGTADDATKFAAFLGLLADAVHKVGGRVSVDTNWGPYLNPGTLSQGNSVDTFCDMQTYGLHDTDFKGDLMRDSNLTTLARYGLGVCPTCCNPCEFTTVFIIPLHVLYPL